MKQKKILIVVGTRPNFIKITRFKEVCSRFSDTDLKIVHTGQHFDYKMADVFFEQLNLKPDYFLNVQPGSANTQMANIMLGLEDLIENTYKPDLLLVVGDVNSTAAAALTANKCGIKLGHIESGLRSFDKTMPEEHNRLIADSLSDYFFVTEPSGYANLLKEGHNADHICMVGNTMIDTLASFTEAIDSSDILDKFKLQKNSYILMTMHRPATVDNKEGLEKLSGLIEKITELKEMVFPIHPRTLKNLKDLGLEKNFIHNKRLHITEPLDYFAFQKLIKNSLAIITDSGGIQEESTWLGVPCITLRPNTERPVTVDIGTNTLMPFDETMILQAIHKVINGTYKTGKCPDMWDGKSTERIVDYIRKVLE